MLAESILWYEKSNNAKRYSEKFYCLALLSIQKNLKDFKIVI